MRQANIANDRRTFWPRAGPAAAFVPDLGDDRYCSNCKYNLRGLPFSSACPECGAMWGLIEQDVEPVPWNDEASAASFLRTTMMVLSSARDLAAQVWTRDVLWTGPAKRFRRVNIAIATVALTPVILAIQAAVIGLDRAIWCLPIDVLCVLWWHVTLTNHPASLFRDKGSPTPSKRAIVLSAYLSAPLVLSLLHLLLLAVPSSYANDEWAALMAALHGSLVVFQVLLIAAAESALLWQLVEVPRGGALAITLLLAGYRLILAGVYLAAIPALFANLAR